MKKARKIRILSIVLALTVAFSATTPCMAVGITKIPTGNITLVTQQNARKTAENLIMMSRQNDIHCIWNDQTTIEKEIPLYNFQDTVNSYLCKLTRGYILVGVYGINTTILAYAYDGDFIAENMFKQTEGREINDYDHIIQGGPFVFLREKAGKFELLDNNMLVSETEIEKIKEASQKFSNTIKQYIFNKSNTVQNERQKLSARVIIDEYTIPHLWDADYQVYTTSDFPGYQNHCAPTAGTNFMYYWGKKANNKKPNLWSGSVFTDLYKYMKTNSGHSGTNFEDKLPGLIQYSESRHVSVAGSDVIAAINFNLYQRTLKNAGPFLLDLIYNDPGKNHTIMVTGYQCVLYDKDYLRVLDGWSSNRSNFFSDLYVCGNLTYTRY